MMRLLNNDDKASYEKLFRHALTAHSESFRISPIDSAAFEIPTVFTDKSFTLGYYEVGELYGAVSIQVDGRVKLNHKALLFRMFIHEKCSGKGIGRMLMEEAVNRVKLINEVRYIYLTVLGSNLRAISLYEKMGFVRFALEVGSVMIGDKYVDEIQMAKQLIA